MDTTKNIWYLTEITFVGSSIIPKTYKGTGFIIFADPQIY
jgi:hypothetical protein